MAVSFRGGAAERAQIRPIDSRALYSQPHSELSNEAMILITSSVFADRGGATYGGKIIPDVVVPEQTQPTALAND